MIFVTVGTQLPFDRLMRAMDDWAAHHPETHVVAQSGKSRFIPVHMEWERHLNKDAFRSRCEKASLIVSHAGIGTILLAMELRKPIVIMPRRADLHEHRNDHQLATAKQLAGRHGIRVVQNDVDLDRTLCEPLAPMTDHAFSPWASEELLETVRQFIKNA